MKGVTNFVWSRLFRATLLALLILPQTGQSAGPAISPSSRAEFIPPGIEEVLKLLPPAPADDSLAGQADLETVLQVQADRTPTGIERAQRVVHHTAFQLGATVLGAWFSPENLPRTAAILAEVQRECHPLLLEAKQRWNRSRPYDRDPRVKPCVELPVNTSYPSGHSASAAIWARLLAAAFPEHQAAFEAQVRETMWSRVLAGVHYPTDTQAGRLIGDAIARRILMTEAMRKAVDEIRAEALPFKG